MMDPERRQALRMSVGLDPRWRLGPLSDEERAYWRRWSRCLRLNRLIGAARRRGDSERVQRWYPVFAALFYSLEEEDLAYRARQLAAQ
jgi:hypothetical protein